MQKLEAGKPQVKHKVPNRRYLFFAVASLGLFMASINSTIVATALPTIQKGLQAQLSWTGWILTGYQLVTLTMMPLMGKISDEWGRKRVFIACIVIFTAGSLLSAFSTNIYWLILFRIIQAFGGSGFMPSAVGIVGDHFADDRARAIGMFTSIFPLGGIIGPALGGWIIDVASWKAIFLVNVPVGIVVLILSYFLLEPDSVKSRTQMDLPGVGLFAAAMVAIMYFMTRIGDDPFAFTSLFTWLLPLLGGILLWAFIRREKVAPSPVLELSLLKNRTFAIINVLNMLYGACIFGLMAFIPYYAHITYGLSNLASGTLLTARALGMMGMSALTSMFINRTGYRIPMTTGFLILAITTLALSPSLHPVILRRTIPDFWWLAVLVFLSGIGVGFVSPSSNNAAIDLMPEKIAVITGLRGTFRQTGGVIGTSAIVLVLSRFHDKVAGFRMVFLAMTILLIIAIPLVRWVPDGRRKT